jgi:hypothetical protein
MEGNFSQTDEQAQAETYEASRFYGSQMVPLPSGDPMLWDTQDEVTAEVCGTLFANEYLYDFHPGRAMERLGVDRAESEALGNRYLRHWFVQRKIRSIIHNFRESNIASEGNILSLMYRDASNFHPLANPVARVNAQKQIAKVMCMEPDDKIKAISAGAKATGGGVMIVPAMGSMADWERETAEEQARLKAEVIL